MFLITINPCKLCGVLSVLRVTYKESKFLRLANNLSGRNVIALEDKSLQISQSTKKLHGPFFSQNISILLKLGLLLICVNF